MKRLLALLAPLIGTAAPAAPVTYTLEPEASIVGFETDFGADKITGQMPVSRADLSLDFQHIDNSHVTVALDVSSAEASFPFAAQAMKGPRVLDAGAYPVISFESTSVRNQGAGAVVAGNITIRGVTRPMEMQAMLWQQTGSAVGDYSHLTIRLTGAITRSDFGAIGWSDMVGDEVRLNIIARIAEVP